MPDTGSEIDSSAAIDLHSLVARLNNLGEIFRVQGEILAVGRAAVPALAAFLAGPPSVFGQPRVAAAECLGIIGGAQALAALLAEVERDHTAIADPVTALAEETVRNAAARQLARFNDPRVVPALLAALSTHHLIGAGEALAGLGEAAALPHLIDCFEDDAKRNPAVEAVRRFRAIGILSLAEALGTPRQVLDAETPSSLIRRAVAAQLLGELNARAALPQLRFALGDHAQSVSIAAALALARTSPAEAVAGPLLAGLDSSDPVTQDECEAALRQLGAFVSAAVRQAALGRTVLLPSGQAHRLSSSARRRAVALLSAVDPPQFIDACPALLHDADASVRYQTVRGLANADHPERAVQLGLAARDRDPRVRAAARAVLEGIDSSHHSWLNRNVVGMGLTSLLSDAGHEMATAVLPAFLATIGLSAAALGAIEGIADAVASLAKLGSGWWSDRIGHRKTITVAGYALTGVAKGLFALAAGWPLVLTGRVLAWFGRGVRGSLRDAMLAESVEPADVGKAFGFHRAGDTVGAIIGPLLGVAAIGLLHGRFPDPSTPFRIVFLLTLIPGLGAALAFALTVRERRRTPNHGLAFWHSIRSLPRPYRRFLVGVFVFGLADFAPTLLILRATDLLSPAQGVAHAAQLAALLYAVRNLFYAGASFPIGLLGDRLGRRGLLAGGYALATLTFIGFMRQSSALPYLVLLFAATGVFIAVEDALEGATAAELLPAETRGLGYGVLGTVNGVGDLFSSVIVGVLWAQVSVTAGLIYATVLSLAGAVLILRVR
jgi:MFS family permease/HEAT repeat protein